MLAHSETARASYLLILASARRAPDRNPAQVAVRGTPPGHADLPVAGPGAVAGHTCDLLSASPDSPTPGSPASRTAASRACPCVRSASWKRLTAASNCADNSATTSRACCG